jgi:hypothetical protein
MVPQQEISACQNPAVKERKVPAKSEMGEDSPSVEIISIANCSVEQKSLSQKSVEE